MKQGLTDKHKGLLNPKGANNCFLNVTIQALWHLGAFRCELQNLFTSTDGFNNDNKAGESEVLSEKKLLNTLGKLFHDYEFTELSVLPPTELRNVLHSMSDRFQLGAFADSNEALALILEEIHNEHKAKCVISSSSSHAQVTGNMKCISHSVFGMSIMDQSVCNLCVGTSEPSIHNDFMLVMSASHAIKESKAYILDPNTTVNFSTILRNCLSVESKGCPSSPKCKGKAHVYSYCLEMPVCIAVSVGWESDKESPVTISSFMSLISYSIDVSEVFPGYIPPAASAPTSATAAAKSASTASLTDVKPQITTSDNNNNNQQQQQYVFRGLICYYGHHYVSIFQEYSPGEAQFLLFDDQRIRKIGNWNDVKIECIKAHYQPVTLLYELEDEDDATVASTATASSAATSSTNTTSTRSESKSAYQRATATLEKEINQMTATINSTLHIDVVPTIPTLHARASMPAFPHMTTAFSSLPKFPRRRASNLTQNLTRTKSTNELTKKYSDFDRNLRASISRSALKKQNDEGNENDDQSSTASSENGRKIDSKGESGGGKEKEKDRIYTVTLIPILCENVYLTGLCMETINDSILVVGFQSHPQQPGKLLPAERSNKIKLLDELLAINNISIVDKKEFYETVMAVLHNAKSSSPIVFTFKAFNYED